MDDRAYQSKSKPSTKSKSKGKEKVEGDSDFRIQKNVNQPLGMMARTIMRIKATRTPR